MALIANGKITDVTTSSNASMSGQGDDAPDPEEIDAELKRRLLSRVRAGDRMGLRMHMIIGFVTFFAAIMRP